MKLGDFMRDRLRAQLEDEVGVIEIRGQGLIIGIELSMPCGELVKRALAKKLLINVTSDNVVRLLPALVMRQEEAIQVIDITCQLIRGFLND